MGAMGTTLSLLDVVHSDPEIMHGTPVFKGTRVPVQALMDHLEAGDSLEVFLDDFPTVEREQAAFLELAGRAALAEIGAGAARRIPTSGIERAPARPRGRNRCGARAARRAIDEMTKSDRRLAPRQSG